MNNESAKNFITCLEERLDNTLLRSVHFKTTYNTHFEGLIPNKTNSKLFERKNFLRKKLKTSLFNKNKSYRWKSIKLKGKLVKKKKIFSNEFVIFIKKSPKKFMKLVSKTKGKDRVRTWKRFNSKDLLKKNYYKRKKYYLRLKKPNCLKSYTPQQIKQWINHGKVLINNKRVYSPNIKVKVTDTVEIRNSLKPLDLNVNSDIFFNKSSLKKYDFKHKF